VAENGGATCSGDPRQAARTAVQRAGGDEGHRGRLVVQRGQRAELVPYHRARVGQLADATWRIEAGRLEFRRSAWLLESRFSTTNVES
jgi:hypothetical protein